MHELSEPERSVVTAAKELAENLIQRENLQAADIAREFALFLEQQGEIGLAFCTMEAARHIRPGGPVIIRKRNEYRQRVSSARATTERGGGVLDHILCVEQLTHEFKLMLFVERLAEG